MSFNKTQQKKIDEFETFLVCAPLQALLKESGLSESALRQAYQLHLLTNKKPRAAPATKKPTTPKTPSVQCMACCWNPGNPLASKQCAKAGTEMVDGVHVCRQHAQDFAGTYKGSGKTSETHPFYCAGCSKDCGQDIFHTGVKSVHCLGTVCGTIKPVCFSKARAHSEYTDAQASITTEGTVTFAPSSDEQPAVEPFSQQVNVQQNEGTELADDLSTTVKNLSTLNIHSKDESGPAVVWEKIRIDLEDGDGEQEYWSHAGKDGTTHVYTNEDDPANREFIAEVEEGEE